MLCYKTAWAAADLDDMLCMDPQGFGLWPSTRGFRGSSAAWEEESRLVSHKSSADRSFLLSKIVQSLLPWRKYEITPYRITDVTWLPSSLTMLWIEPSPLFVLLVRRATAGLALIPGCAFLAELGLDFCSRWRLFTEPSLLSLFVPAMTNRTFCARSCPPAWSVLSILGCTFCVRLCFAYRFVPFVVGLTFHAGSCLIPPLRQQGRSAQFGLGNDMLNRQGNAEKEPVMTIASDKLSIALCYHPS